MYNVQDYSILYNNPVRPVRCEDWHFTHMQKALISLRGEVLIHNISGLTPPLVIEVPVPCQEIVFSYIYWCPTRFLYHMMLLSFKTITQRVSLVEQELPILPEHLGLSRFCVVLVFLNLSFSVQYNFVDDLVSFSVIAAMI